MTFGPLGLEEKYLEENKQTALARAQADQKYTRGNWAAVANLLSKWGDHGPTLPPGGAVGLAHAGIDPGDPLGLKIINDAAFKTPVVQRPDPRPVGGEKKNPTNHPFGLPPVAPMQGLQGPTPEGAAAPQGLMGPEPEKGLLGRAGDIAGGVGRVAASAGGAVAHGVSAGVEAAQRDIGDPVDRLIGRTVAPATGETPEMATQRQASFAPGKEAVEGVGSALNAGLQAVNVGIKAGGATPMGQGFGAHGQGTMVTSTDPRTLFNPKQITLYNQLIGHQSLQEAEETQAEAARAASSITYNGESHAYTVGRGLASSVVTPGTRPYALISGIADATVAFQADPAAIMMKELSETRTLGRTFTKDTEEAYIHTADHLLAKADTSNKMVQLRNWTGIPAEVSETAARGAAEAVPRVVEAAMPNGKVARAAMYDRLMEIYHSDPDEFRRLIGHPGLVDEEGAAQHARSAVNRPKGMRPDLRAMFQEELDRTLPAAETAARTAEAGGSAEWNKLQAERKAITDDMKVDRGLEPARNGGRGEALDAVDARLAELESHPNWNGDPASLDIQVGGVTSAGTAANPDLRAAIIDKLKANPGAASILTEGENVSTTPQELLTAMAKKQMGGSTFLRDNVHQPTAMTWLNSQAGQDFAQQIADNPSFTNIWHATGKKLPINLVSALTDARTADDVKFILVSELGTTP